jgi:hypothetical protein
VDRRHRRTRRLLTAVFWLFSVVGIVGAIVAIVVTMVTWPRLVGLGLLVTIYGIAHAIVFGILARTVAPTGVESEPA